MRRALVILVLAPILSVGCGGDDDDELTACESAMKEAHDVDEMQDTVTDLDPAIAACSTLAEFEAASEKYPDALDGAPLELFISNRCADAASGPICEEVGG